MFGSSSSPTQSLDHPDEVTFQQLEQFDYISVELVPERKGLILKHSEYALSSRRHGTTVMRRYSDFVELHDILLAKYPYRAVCALPPKRVVVGRGSSTFLERRRAALQRWLSLTAAHPLLAHDADTRAFLCEVEPRLQRPQHDEFSLAAPQLTQAECVTEEMTNAFTCEQEQLGLIRLGLARLAQLFARADERSVAARSEMQELGAALTSLSAPSGAAAASDSAPAWLRVRQALRRAATTTHRACESDVPCAEAEGLLRLRLALDAVGGHRDLCTRLTRGLHAERARAAARSTSLSQAGAASVLRARHCYALSCAAAEARVARAYALAALEALPEVMHSYAVSHARLATLWAELSKALQNTGRVT